MLRVLVLTLVSLLLLGSCTQKLICPAYQSAFIYDQEALRKKFSYFNEDSTPKILTVSKNKYLIIPEQSYRKKIRSMKTVEMKPVYVVLPDSLKPESERAKKDDEFKGAERAPGDSTDVSKPTRADSSASSASKEGEDSTYVITKDKEMRILRYDKDSSKYRVEQVRLMADQDTYMWYMRDYLVLPDVRAAMQDQKNAKEEKAEAAKVKKKKVGFFGFFKNLFKKKSKESDSTKNAVPAIPPIDSDDPADSTAALSPPDVKPPPPPAKKKGFFSFLKKGKKKVDKKEPEPIDPAVPPVEKKDPVKKEDGF